MSAGDIGAHPWFTSAVFSLLHYKPLWKGVWKQRPKSLGRQSGLKTGHWKVAHSCFHYVYFFPKHLGKPHPSLQYLLWGASIISEGPSGHSVTHPPGKWHGGFKWDMTFASGIIISKWCCVMLHPSPLQKPSQSGGRIKIRDCEGHT